MEVLKCSKTIWRTGNSNPGDVWKCYQHGAITPTWDRIFARRRIIEKLIHRIIITLDIRVIGAILVLSGFFITIMLLARFLTILKLNGDYLSQGTTLICLRKYHCAFKRRSIFH